MIISKLLVRCRGVLAVGALLAVWASATGGASAATGEQNFAGMCAGCHTIGAGNLVGPDLKGVNDRYSEEWLIKFIKSSQAVVKSGDPDAVARFDEFNKVVMPDAPYSPDEIKEILAFIKSSSAVTAAQGAPAEALAVVAAASPEDIRKGQGLFQGTVQFANGGPACNSCHHVKNDAVIGGGILAKELTSVFSRMGGPGVQAILGKAPFPVMEQAYMGKALTADEVTALVGFLQDADQHQALQKPADYGLRLVFGGTGGFVVLMGLYGFLGRRRKKLPVNHEIFERQVKTQ